MTEAATTPDPSTSTSASSRGESYFGGEGGQASLGPAEESGVPTDGLPFGGRVPAAVFLVAAALMAALLVALIVTPLNR
jgi:hypothetical protein